MHGVIKLLRVMKSERGTCIHYRQEDGCKWCEEGCSSCNNCEKYVKRLSGVEVQRVADLMKVWQYLYDNRVYDLCDIVSKEIGIIKGVEL